MNQKPTPEIALADLYRAARMASLPADVHERLSICAQVLQDVVNPPAPEPDNKKK